MKKQYHLQQTIEVLLISLFDWGYFRDISQNFYRNSSKPSTMYLQRSR